MTTAGYSEVSRSFSNGSMTNRQGFSSRIGFILAAAGSAVGLGNIWGFPTQVANHGGGAFILVYILVLLLLAIPALYAEMSIGFQQRANPVKAMKASCQRIPLFGLFAGYSNIVGAILMLSFYSIIAGWMFAHSFGSLFTALGWETLAGFVPQSGITRNLLFAALVIMLTALIILGGVQQGIERWSKRLMPLLLLLLVGLIIYILQLPGAYEGLTKFLKPDFTALSDPQLVLAAMGQAFFSLSIGVGGMLVYGSYLKQGENLGKLSLSIAGLDTLIAFLAGMLVIPALFVAQTYGYTIMSNGELVGRSELIFDVLPKLFNNLGTTGTLIGFSFFTLLAIASLTSTIASTEVPVSYLTENHQYSRQFSTLLVTLVVSLICATIVFNFELLFRAVIGLLTHYMLPLMGLVYFIVTGWLRPQPADAEAGLAGKLLKVHLRFICPALMLLVFYQVAF